MSSNNSGNGILITMIVFIVLTLGLGVGEYFTAKALSEAKSTAASEKEKATKAEQDAAKLRTASEKLRDLIGVGYTKDGDSAKLIDDLNSLCDDLAARWNEITGDSSDVPKTCIAVIEGLVSSLEQKNQMLENSESDRNSYEQMAYSEEAKTTWQKEEFDNTVTQITEENQNRQKDADARFDTLNSQNLELAKKVETIQAEAKEVNDRYKTEAADAKESVKYVAGINKELRSKIDQLTDPLFEIPDGLIVYVDQENRVVRLNIGEADGVRLLTTFGVYASDSLEKGEIQSKGSLEVIRIVGEHESEARILDDEMENPFTPGDMIYTPLWKTGTETRIALDYFLDVDGDDKDDIDLLVNIINASGGKVSAWVDKSGDLQGKISSDVTYLITSNTPINEVMESDPDTPAEIKDKIVNAHTKLLEDAQNYSVRTMKLSEFLRRTHYKQSAEVSRYQEPGGMAKRTDRSGAPIISDAAIAPIYDERTKDAKTTSFGVTAPIYNPNRVDSPQSSSGKVSDTYFRKRSPKEL